MTAKYKYNGSSSTGFESNGGLFRYSLSDINTCSHLSSHKNLLLPFSESKKGRHLSVALEINLLRAATLPVKLWTSFILLGDLMLMRACIFSGLASILQWLTIKPKNFLEATPNAHFNGFSFIRYLLRIAKELERCTMWSVAVFDLMSMSST